MNLNAKRYCSWFRHLGLLALIVAPGLAVPRGRAQQPADPAGNEDRAVTLRSMLSAARNATKQNDLDAALFYYYRYLMEKSDDDTVRMEHAGILAANNKQYRRRAMKPILLMLGWSDYSLQLGAMRYARDAGWSLDSHYSRMGKLLRHREWDGVIALTPHGDNPIRRYLKQLSCPVVDLDRHDLDDGFYHVTVDDERCGVLAAEHLLERGFRHMAFFGHDFAPVHCGRLDGFRRRLEQEGLTPAIIPWAQADELDLFLRESPKPSGLVAIGDDLAVEVLVHCRELELAVPERIAVLGIDNSVAACELAPGCTLSSVDVQIEEVAWLAASTLDRLMQGDRHVPKALTHPAAGVVLRRSTDIIAVADERLACALRILWDRFSEPLNGEKLSALVGCSKRTLSDLFRRQLGRGIHAELTRKRMEHAMHLAATTDMKQYEIARQCGYENALVFGQAFQRVRGERWCDAVSA